MPSLLEALEKKYFSTECQFGGVDPDDAAAETGERLISIFIPRLSPLLSVPELLVLNDCDIDCAGDFESIKEKCQRVRELDLAQNNLQDWQEVFDILKHMPRIEFLNLSKNRLASPMSRLLHSPTISNLRSMVLNGTYLDWLCVETLLGNLPLLEELHLSLNDYKEVLIDAVVDAELANDAANASHEIGIDLSSDSLPSPCSSPGCVGEKCKKVLPHRTLKTLHFTGNPIESWQEVCRLGRIFPNLENLVLADCPIKAILVCDSPLSSSPSPSPDRSTEVPSATADDCPHKHFANLVFLNLSYASMNAWDDIDHIAKFPNLKNLRVKSWPLWDRLECTEHERRQLLIARLPNVQLLNGGGVISADEREDSERAFIRHYMEKPECERPQRYDDLVAKHGKLEPLVDINLKPDKRIKILLTFNEKSEPRLVDTYRTVADLKVRLEKVVGLPAKKMRLYYLDKDYKDSGPEEMKYPNKQLYSYNIQEGDEIIVDEKK